MKDAKLSPKRREALERLRAGGVAVADKHNIYSVDGWEFVPQNVRWLLARRLIRVLNPARATHAAGNGYVITQEGLDLLASFDAS